MLKILQEKKNALYMWITSFRVLFSEKNFGTENPGDEVPPLALCTGKSLS